MKSTTVNNWVAKGILSLAALMALPSASFAVTKIITIDYSPSLYVGRFQAIDLVSELQYRGYQVASDAKVLRVDVLAKAADYRSSLELEVGRDRGYPANLRPSRDFNSEHPMSFDRVSLTAPVNRGGHYDRGYDNHRSDYDRGGYGAPPAVANGRATLLINGTIKIAQLQVTVDELPPARWSHLEGFKPALGVYSTERVRISRYVGSVQSIALEVDKRDIDVKNFIVILENGRRINVRELEGFIRQKSNRVFDVRRRYGLNVAEIIIEAQTTPRQNGRAQVDLSVLHRPDY